MHEIRALHGALDHCGAILFQPARHGLALDVDVLLIAGGVGALRRSGERRRRPARRRRDPKFQFGEGWLGLCGIEVEDRLQRFVLDFDCGKLQPRAASFVGAATRATGSPTWRTTPSARIGQSSLTRRTLLGPVRFLSRHTNRALGCLVLLPVDRSDAGVGVGTAKRRAPVHSFDLEIVGVGVATGGLGYTVGAWGAGADVTATATALAPALSAAKRHVCLGYAPCLSTGFRFRKRPAPVSTRRLPSWYRISPFAITVTGWPVTSKPS